MFKIKVGDKFLHMGSKYSLTYYIKSPLFDFDVIEGDFTTNFSIPTKYNDFILDYPQIIPNSNSTDKSIDIDIYLHNEFWKKGVLVIKEANTKTIKLHVKTAAGEFNIKTAPKNMNEIDYGVSSQIPEAFRYKLCLISAAPGRTSSHYIYINIDPTGVDLRYYEYYDTDITTTVSNLVDRINADFALTDIKAEYKFLKNDKATGNELCFLYLHNSTFGDKVGYILAHSYYGFTDHVTAIDSDVFDWGGEHKGIRDHMTFQLDWQIGDENYYRAFFENRQYIFPEFMNHGAWGGVGTRFSTILSDNIRGNVYDPTASPPKYQSSVSAELITPFPFVKYILVKILQDSGYLLSGTAFLDEEISKLILYNNYSIDNINEFGVNLSIADVIDLRNHVPEFSCGKFLNGLKKIFGWGIFFNPTTKECMITPIKEILRSTKYEDWTDIVEPFMNVQSTNYAGFRFSFSPDSTDNYSSERLANIDKFTMKEAVQSESSLPTSGNDRGDIRIALEDNDIFGVDTIANPHQWAFISQGLTDHKIGDGQNNIKSELIPVFMEKHPSIDDPIFYSGITNLDTLVPLVKQRVTSVMFAYSFPEFTPRLLFWRGKELDNNDNLYPFASYDVYNHDFERIADYAIKWNGKYGLINTWWKDYIIWRKNTRPVTHILRMTRNELLNIDLSKKKRIAGGNYLIKQLKIIFSNETQDIILVEAEMYTTSVGIENVDYISDNWQLEDEDSASSSASMSLG